MTKNYRRVKYGCYVTNVAMSVVCNLSPVLFLTFRQLYGISFSLLGSLVLIGFFTQLLIDLAFSFFSHKFNIPAAVKLTPVLTVVGLVLYALLPVLLPKKLAYLGIAFGTVVFSASGGLSEVLLSSVVAAIPSENPDREMSKLHSVYAWGVVAVIVVSTFYLLAFGGENWIWLAFLFALIPLAASALYFGQEIPPLKTPERASGVKEYLKNKRLWLCVFAIFLGGAAECTMSQWSSSYLERALGIPKALGDVFGVAVFAVALGIGRSLYAKIGKNIEKVLFFGGLGAAGCYLIAALSPFAVVGLIACAFTGFCTSMLWPGSLIVGEKKFPTGGVFIFAMMAAGGDCGASVAPQLVGVVTDVVAGSAWGADLALRLGISLEQIGMRAGMLVGSLFPIAAIVLYFVLWKGSKKEKDVPVVEANGENQIQ